METTGIVRKIDELGRLVLPKEYRTILGIQRTDPVEIHLVQDAIIVRKYEPACTLCGSREALRQVNGKTICAQCVRDIRAMEPDGDA